MRHSLSNLDSSDKIHYNFVYMHQGGGGYSGGGGGYSSGGGYGGVGQSDGYSNGAVKMNEVKDIRCGSGPSTRDKGKPL